MNGGRYGVHSDANAVADVVKVDGGSKSSVLRANQLYPLRPRCCSCSKRRNQNALS
jgi:hypothetical protein